VARKTYIVYFKPPETTVQPVRGAAFGVMDGYLVFRDGEGEIIGMFLLEIVETWSLETKPS
jgi:hypothetical protein